MKVLSLAALALFSQSVSAHYIWNNLIYGSGSTRAAIRMPVSNSPVENVSSLDIRCNANPGQASETVSVAAGSTIGFDLDNTIYHQGPAAMYLGKAPGSVASWDGSGNAWFKVRHFSLFTIVDMLQVIEFLVCVFYRLLNGAPLSTPSSSRITT